MKSNRITAGIFAGALTVGMAGTALAATTTITEADLGSTVAVNVVGDDSGVAISTDAGAPAGFGNGSLLLFTEDDNQARAEVFVESGMSLSDVGDVSYATFQPDGNIPRAAVALKLGIQSDEGFTTLVYEPYWQNDGAPDDAPVEAGEWQTWADAQDGFWWSSSTVGGLNAGFGGPPFYTLADADAALTNATVAYWQLGIGSYNPDWSVYADAVTIAGETFDFEPAPSTKDDCKQGGWETLTGPGGEEFRNQGDCVSFFASDGRSRG